MKSFPMFFSTTGRRIVIAGGGEQAAQKARLILKTDAKLILAAAELDDELMSLVDTNRAKHHSGPITGTVFDHAAMAFIATGCPGADASLQAVARDAHCPVNVVDRPELCDLFTPAIVDRDPIVVAIGSEGTAPVLTRSIKTRLEAMLPQTLGGLAAMAGRLRPSVNRRVPREQRRSFWSWVFKSTPHRDWIRGRERDAARSIKMAIADGRPPDGAAGGQVSLIGSGSGSPDLLTLRAVERLQEADIVFYDRKEDEPILELARRDIERVFVGRHAGAHAWPRERIDAVIMAEAQKGRRVVCLQPGDPSASDNAKKELSAVEDAGIPIDVVPGVSDAIAASACGPNAANSKTRLVLQAAEKPSAGTIIPRSARRRN